MNIDKYTYALEGIKVPDFLKKRTAELLRAESSKSKKSVLKKGITKKAVARNNHSFCGRNNQKVLWC